MAYPKIPQLKIIAKRMNKVSGMVYGTYMSTVTIEHVVLKIALIYLDQKSASIISA